MSSSDSKNIFVSYAWVDNKEKQLGLPKGWVSNLVETLENLLGQTLGRADAFQLWMDTRKDRDNLRLTDDILPKVKKSSTLLMILSPGYLQSKWCQAELRAFLESYPADNSENLKRIFIIEKNIFRIKRPEVLEKCLAYPFWYEDENKRIRTLGLPKFNPNETDYYYEVQNIAYDLADEFDRIKGGKS